MEIVVAQHHGDVVAVGIEPAQRFQVSRAAIDQVTHAPQAIFIRIEFHLFQQALEWLKASLDVADDVGTHSAG